MEPIVPGSDSLAPAAAEADVLLIEQAIAMVRTGVTPRVVVVGVAIGDDAFRRARTLADASGLRLVSLAGGHPGRTDVAVEGGAARRAPGRPLSEVLAAPRRPFLSLTFRRGGRFRPIAI